MYSFNPWEQTQDGGILNNLVENDYFEYFFNLRMISLM